MGTFHVECEVVGVRGTGRAVSVRRVLVDSGSELTWLPGSVLARAGVAVAKRALAFVMADGRTVTRPAGYAIVRAGGFETVDEVIFAEPGDLALLGARTLEGFGAVVDPRRRRLVAAGPHPAASTAAAHFPVLSRSSAKSPGSSGTRRSCTDFPGGVGPTTVARPALVFSARM